MRRVRSHLFMGYKNCVIILHFDVEKYYGKSGNPLSRRTWFKDPWYENQKRKTPKNSFSSGKKEEDDHKKKLNNMLTDERKYDENQNALRENARLAREHLEKLRIDSGNQHYGSRKMVDKGRHQLERTNSGMKEMNALENQGYGYEANKNYQLVSVPSEDRLVTLPSEGRLEKKPKRVMFSARANFRGN